MASLRVPQVQGHGKHIPPIEFIPIPPSSLMISRALADKSSYQALVQGELLNPIGVDKV